MTRSLFVIFYTLTLLLTRVCWPSVHLGETGRLKGAGIRCFPPSMMKVGVGLEFDISLPSYELGMGKITLFRVETPHVL